MEVKDCPYLKDADDLNPFPLVEDCDEKNCADVNSDLESETELESDSS